MFRIKKKNWKEIIKIAAIETLKIGLLLAITVGGMFYSHRAGYIAGYTEAQAHSDVQVVLKWVHEMGFQEGLNFKPYQPEMNEGIEYK